MESPRVRELRSPSPRSRKSVNTRALEGVLQREVARGMVELYEAPS